MILKTRRPKTSSATALFETATDAVFHGIPTKELRIDDVQVNPPLTDSLFAPPR